MASAKLVLYTSKKLKNNTHPVVIQVIHNRKVKRVSTGMSCKLMEWEPELECFTRKKRSYKRDNVKLSKIKTKIEYALDWFDRYDVPFSIERFLQKFGQRPKPMDLLAVFEELRLSLIAEKRIGYSEVFRDTARAIKKFIDEKTIVLQDIDFKFLHGFEVHLKKRGCTNGGIHVYMRTLRAAYNYAISMGYVPEELYPFARNKRDIHKYSLAKIKPDTNPVALSMEDMSKFKIFHPNGNSHLELAHKIFLFSYYARGMNFTDIAHLEWRHIYDGRIRFKRAKSKKFYDIRLTEPLSKIITSFKDVNKGGYIFPILDNNVHRSATQIKDRIKKCLQQHNRSLKLIAESLGIQINLSSNIARHTYAMTLRRNKISDDIISNNLGHSDIKVTRHYLSKLSNSVYDEADEVL